jgi:hypothetical protein
MAERLPESYKIKYGKFWFLCFLFPFFTGLLQDWNIINNLVRIAINSIFLGLMLGLVIAAAAPIWIKNERQEIE